MKTVTIVEAALTPDQKFLEEFYSYQQGYKEELPYEDKISYFSGLLNVINSYIVFDSQTGVSAPSLCFN